MKKKMFVKKKRDLKSDVHVLITEFNKCYQIQSEEHSNV